MKPIYEPKGKAKEYGDYALNIYTGCPHRCYYCFAPSVLRRDREKFHSDIRPREGIDVPNYGIKRVYCVTNGEVYPSASFAAKKLGLIDSSVAKVCRGRYKHTGGMVFRYV